MTRRNALALAVLLALPFAAKSPAQSAAEVQELPALQQLMARGIHVGEDDAAQRRIARRPSRRLHQPAATTVERLVDDNVRTVTLDDAARGAAASADNSLSGGAGNCHGVENLVRDLAPPRDDVIAPHTELASLEVHGKQRMVLHLRRDDGVRL